MLLKTGFYLLLFCITLVFGLTFYAQNPQVISIQYYFGFLIEVPLVVIIFTSMTIGVILGWMSAFLGRLFKKNNRRVHKQRSKINVSPNTMALTEANQNRP